MLNVRLMELIYKNIHHGNLKMYDVRSKVNLHKLIPTFERLQVDPYIAEGYRRKHLLWLNCNKIGQKEWLIEKLDRNDLFQSSSYNPVHGNIKRTYPLIKTNDPMIIDQIVMMFLDSLSEQDRDIATTDILLQFQRITTSREILGKPSVENWHQDGVDDIGIICVNRENIIGGINEFKRTRDSKEILQKELPPGYMVTFKDSEVFHRVTDIECANDNYIGWRDVILIATCA